MTSLHRLLKNLLGLALCIGLIACQKSEDVIPDPGPGAIEQGPGIAASEFDTYAGEIGLLLNAREIARKGYQPAKAMVKIDANSGDFSQMIELDESAFMGRLNIPVEQLSEEARKELIAGVPVSVTVLDGDGKTILSDVNMNTVSLLANPSPQTIPTGGLVETEEVAVIELSEGAAYYLQKVEEDGSPVNQCMRWNRNAGYGNVMTVSTNNTFAGDQPDHVFNFEAVPGKPNTFYIRLEASNFYIFSDIVIAILNDQLITHQGPKISPFQSLPSGDRKMLQFSLRKVKEGVYTLLDYRGRAAREAPGLGLTFAHPTGKAVYWRPVAKSIAWTVQPIASDIISPVLPKATTGFSFNSTLKNCGSGSLEQTVGADFSEERSHTFGWAEAISINNSSSQSVGATIGVEFDAKFFGAGATYNASLTTSFDWSQSVTKETSSHSSETLTRSETYFSERTITVPPKKASLVYDAYQFYENVRVDFVQRLRLSGIDEDGKALSGEEIRSLFQFSRFNGVINKVEAHSVVFTLRGYTVLDKFIETQSSVEDVAANCE